MKEHVTKGGIFKPQMIVFKLYKINGVTILGERRKFLSFNKLVFRIFLITPGTHSPTKE